MTLEQFTAQITRLCQVYDRKYYPDDRVAILFDHFGRHDAEVFAEAISDLIAENFHPPTSTKVRDAIRAVYDRRGGRSDPNQHIRDEIRAKMQLHDGCWKCGNSGVVTGSKKYFGLCDTMVLCNCRLGSLAGRLPEYRGLRLFEAHDPFYIVLDTDPHKAEKLEIYRDLYGSTSDPTFVQLLNHLYCTKEAELGPLPWVYQAPRNYALTSERNNNFIE